jgi:FkbM family methyltransferase
MIDKFNTNFVLVDPTPVSVDHYNKIINAAGIAKTKEYTLKPEREIEEYNLKKINSKNLVLINKALYNEERLVKFYHSPIKTNPLNDNFSHSINNWQSYYDKNKPYIEVETIKIQTIMKLYNILSLPILKIDIEGAEHQVIDDMLKSKIFPSQILVDMDELGLITIYSYKKLVSIYNNLLNNNYNLIDTGDLRNFLFIRSL